MVKTTVRLPAHILEEAQKEAERRGISFAELDREALLRELGRADAQRAFEARIERVERQLGIRP